MVALRKGNEIKRIYLSNPCNHLYGCILIRSRNAIEIFNDTIYKAWELYYSLDSLDKVLKKDFENNGKDPFYSDSPDKLQIRVYYTHY